jgi:hypothetical protein
VVLGLEKRRVEEYGKEAKKTHIRNRLPHTCMRRRESIVAKNKKKKKNGRGVRDDGRELSLAVDAPPDPHLSFRQLFNV